MAAATKPDSGGGPTPLAAAIVPARLASSRLPRKMLLRETGRFLFEHTSANLAPCASLCAVWIATDDREIAAAAEEVGVRALLTSADHPSGTDRVHEAYTRLVESGEASDWEVVVNVQGDEPELPLEDVEALVAAFADPAVEIATLAAPIHTEAELDDPSVVKVVCDRAGRALYFSRAAIPSRVHPSRPPKDGALTPGECQRHVGVYAFRPAALKRFCELPVGRLEATESLEQLRWLENGGSIQVLAASRVTHGIDTPQDYRAFVERVQASRTP